MTTEIDSESFASTSAGSSENTCRLLGILPFTRQGKAIDEEILSVRHQKPSFLRNTFPVSHMAAALLAVDHFNTRNDTVVRNLHELQANCSVTLEDPIFLNSNFDSVTVAQSLLNLAFDNRRYCGILGPYFNGVTAEVSSFANGMNVPLISHHADDIFVTDNVYSPHVILTYADIFAQTRAALSWLLRNGRTDFLAVVHVAAPYGAQYQQAFERDAPLLAGMQHVQFFQIAPPFVGRTPQVGIAYALQQIRALGYRNIFVALNDEAQIPILADYAEAFGMNRGKHVWMIAHMEQDLEYLVHLASVGDANVTKFVHGLAAVRPLDGFTHRRALNQVDPFFQAWKGPPNREDLVHRLNALHPLAQQSPETPGYYQAPPTYFQDHDPLPGSAFMYDAVMLQALGRCQQERQDQLPIPKEEGRSGPGGSSRRRTRRRRTRNDERQYLRATEEGAPDDRRFLQEDLPQKTTKKVASTSHPNAHVDGIYSIAMQGATGNPRYAERKGYPGSRNSDSVAYGVYNFRSLAEANASQTTGVYLTDVLTNGTINGTWTATQWAPFIFANNLTVPPERNIDEAEQNYLSDGTRTLGLLLFALAAGLSILSMVFVFGYRRHAVLVQSQPPFLLLIVFGCLLLSCAMFLFSFDENRGWSDTMLDRACLSSVWFMALGYNAIYSALACKLWRINKVLQAKRQRVTLVAAMKPFVVSVLCTMGVLWVWTIADPLAWERRPVDEDSLEEYGRCRSDKSTVYVTTLVGLMTTTTLVCAHMAWKTKDIDRRFSESSWIFYTIFVQIQVLVLGIPVLVILNTASADATYLGRVIVLFSLVLTNLCLMIGPRVVRLVQQQQQQQQTNNSKAIMTKGRSASSSRSTHQAIGGVKRGGLGQVHISGLESLHCDTPLGNVGVSPLPETSQDDSVRNESGTTTNESATNTAIGVSPFLAKTSARATLSLGMAEESLGSSPTIGSLTTSESRHDATEPSQTTNVASLVKASTNDHGFTVSITTSGNDTALSEKEVPALLPSTAISALHTGSPPTSSELGEA